MMNIIRHAEWTNVLQRLRLPQQRSWIIVNADSLADTATMCALAAAFVKQHGYGITMIVPPEHVALTDMFPNRFLQVLPLARSGIDYLLENYIAPHRFELDVPFCAHPYHHGDGRSDRVTYLYKFPGRGGLSQTDALRYLLRLPWDAPLERPQIPLAWQQQALQLADSVGLTIGKSVLLLPLNSSTRPAFPEYFWQHVAARLTQHGYQVFTPNYSGLAVTPMVAVAGTTAIDMPWHLALPLLTLAGRGISGVHELQYLQLLGGSFGQMTVAMPIASDFADADLGRRRSNPTAHMAQFMHPELCLGQPLAEFVVPFDGAPQELERLALAIADQAFADPHCFKRMAADGQSYTDQNADWLMPLVQAAA